MAVPLEDRRIWKCTSCGHINTTPNHPEFRCQNTAKCNLPMRVCALAEKATIRGRKVVSLVGVRKNRGGSQALDRAYESLKAQFEQAREVILESAKVACAAAVPNASEKEWPVAQYEELGNKLRKSGLAKELLTKFGYVASARAYRHHRYADIPNEFDLCELPIDVRNFLYLHAVLARKLTATSHHFEDAA